MAYRIRVTHGKVTSAMAQAIALWEVRAVEMACTAAITPRISKTRMAIVTTDRKDTSANMNG